MQRAALARSLADPNGEWAEHVAARCLAGLHSVADAGLVSALRREIPAGWEAARIDEDPLWQLAQEAWSSPATLLQGRFKPSVRWLRRLSDKTVCALLLLSGSLLVGGLHHQQMARQNESRIAGLSQRLLPGQTAPAFAEQAAKAQVRRMQDALNAPQLFRLLPYAAGALALWASRSCRHWLSTLPTIVWW